MSENEKERIKQLEAEIVELKIYISRLEAELHRAKFLPPNTPIIMTSKFVEMKDE